MLPLVAFALVAAKPMPGPKDLGAQERASQCIYYYRLQVPVLPGGADACERDGYGLEFMRLHFAEVVQVERQKQAELDAKLAHARAVQAAVAQRRSLEAPCTQMILDGGAGPDGGQALCDLAGFTRVVVTRTAGREAIRAAQAASRRPRHWTAFWIVAFGAVFAAFVGLVAVLWRGRSGRPTG